MVNNSLSYSLSQGTVYKLRSVMLTGITLPAPCVMPGDYGDAMTKVVRSETIMVRSQAEPKIMQYNSNQTNNTEIHLNKTTICNSAFLW